MPRPGLRMLADRHAACGAPTDALAGRSTPESVSVKRNGPFTALTMGMLSEVHFGMEVSAQIHLLHDSADVTVA